MIFRFDHRIVLLSCIGLALACFAGARTWTNNKGVTMEGTIVSADEKSIGLRLADGREEKIPRHLLSAEDEQYVVQWLDGKDSGAEPAAENGPAVPHVSPTARQGDSWQRPWPSIVKTMPVVVKTIHEKNAQNLYQSDHFTYEADRPLLPAELDALARECETCLAALAALPLNLHLASRPRNKCRVNVYFDKTAYENAGGERGTAMTTRPTHIVALLKRNAKGKPVRLESLKAMHEMTHWVTQFAGSHFWLNEGLARYMDLAVRSKGQVAFDDDLNKVAMKVPRIYRRGWESLPPLETVFGVVKEGDSGKMDAAVLLVTTYFIRLDGQGDAARLKAYVKAIQEGQADPDKLNAILLDGRSWKELEKNIRESWKKHMTPEFEVSKN